MNFSHHRLCLALLTVSVMGACQALDSNSPVAVVPNQVDTPVSPLPGGAVDQSIESPLAKYIQDKAQNLLNQKYPEMNIELQVIYSFKTQVVAGTNYMLEVAYTDQSSVPGKLMLTIYKNLEDVYVLTQDNYPG